MYAQIIIDIAHTNVDRRYTYAVPDGMQIGVGAHVRVPFGRGNRATEGFVIALYESAPDENFPLKEVMQVLEPYPVFTEEQLELAVWMQRSYHCLLVDALRLMIPAQLRGGRIKEKTERFFCLPDDLSREDVKALLYKKDGAPRALKQAQVFEHIASKDAPVAMKELQAYVENPSPAIAALIKKGLLVESGHVTFRRPDVGRYSERAVEVELTDAQRMAVDEITAAMEKGTGIFLLHGVTGSGKTEIYMRAIQACISAGRNAILLVPEIALTPQTMGLFRARFGDEVAVLHSRLSAGERFDEWRRIRLNIAKVAVGARSAVFAPFENIGLIVIDEEHEQTYQSETMPRYHAREVARRRCAKMKGTLVLGSATPSIESYFRAQNGVYTRIDLPERVQSRPMPDIRVVDMREEFLAGNNGIFSNTLFRAMQDCLGAGKQAILFINRRGYSTFVSCRGCGHVFECPECDISMTYHRTEERLKCHYCGHTEGLPAACPSCGRPYVKYFGVGTQQVEEQLREFFPGVKAMRVDLDTTRFKGAHERIFSAFARGEAQVLIGTQMVAKGLDFPNVTLVGVVAADSTLHLPDYRSSERTFQLLMQVSGRAGRDISPGVVVVQSYTPAHPSIRFAAAHDYKGFFTHELLQRRAAIFPPYALFIRLLISAREERELMEDSARLHKGMEAAAKSALPGEARQELLYLSASPAPIRKKQGIYRYQVLMKLLRTRHTAAVMQAVYAYLDTDPINRPVTLEVNPGELF